MNTDLLTAVAENVLFVLEFLGIVLAIFLIATFIEKVAKKRNNDTERILSTKKVVLIGMLSAVATVLMLFEVPVPFAPSFYKLDLSELPALVAGFAYGPVAGIMVEFVKILLKTVVKGTSTAFVGELANFVIGCGLILPATVIYSFKKNKKMAMIACVTGTLVISIIGPAFNAVYLLPAFSKLYGMPMEAIIGMGAAINPAINSVGALVIFCVAPLNFIKGAIDCIITMLIYKPLSRILK